MTDESPVPLEPERLADIPKRVWDGYGPERKREMADSARAAQAILDAVNAIHEATRPTFHELGAEGQATSETGHLDCPLCKVPKALTFWFQRRITGKRPRRRVHQTIAAKCGTPGCLQFTGH